MNIFSLPNQCFLNQYWTRTNYKNQLSTVMIQHRFKIRGKLIEVNFCNGIMDETMKNEAVAMFAAQFARSNGWKRVVVVQDIYLGFVSQNVRITNFDTYKNLPMKKWDTRINDLIIDTNAIREHIQNIKGNENG